MDSDTANTLQPDSVPALPGVASENAPTPPPTQQVLQQNFPGQPLRPATFEEFPMSMKSTSPPRSLNPDQPVLDSEIQQITAEEFDRNIHTAETAMLDLMNLRLPRSLKRKIKECAHQIEYSKSRAIPEDEGIRINQGHPSRQSSPNTTLASTSTKRPRKQAKKSHTVNPASLLSNTDDPAAPTGPKSPATVTGNTDLPSPVGNTTLHPPLPAAPTLPPHTSSSTPAATSGNTTFDKDSQTISPDEVFKPTGPTELLPGTQQGTDLSSTDGNAVPSDVPPAPQDTQPPKDSTGQTKTPTPAPADPLAPGSAPTLPTNPSTSGPQGEASFPSNLTVLKSADARIAVIKISQEVEGVKPNWQRYTSTWDALTQLANFRAESLQSASPNNPDFHFARTTCSYTSWLKTISSLANDFLSPSLNDQWNCPDVVDFGLISVFAEREKNHSTEPFMSPTVKTKHPESTITRFLHRLQSPTPTVISEWAKIIAASVEVMAFKLYNPPPPTPDSNNSPLEQGLQVLKWLDQLKKSLSTFDTTEDTQSTSVAPPAASSDATTPATAPSTNSSSAPEGEVVLRSHATDVLKEFAKLIIEVYMGYVIFQIHALNGRPLKNSQIKQQSRAKKASVKTSAPNSAVAQTTPGDTVTQTKAHTQQLKSYQSRHNFQPLVYFLVAGVRGLFISSRNHRTSPVSECMSFIQAMAVITQHSKVIRTPDEPIWKNLSAYLFQIFQPAFQSPGQIASIKKKPDPQELAQAITIDFLTHWKAKQPTSPFMIPQAPHQITEK
ncbi:hypothetical protein PGTUg99_006333 [Puccinia graminis f. sp. tritici]|uniref:Uncharacterized protein n=1 Tax=Puccinia graminis f. sp. tritici TaxID=56615 RepID=A0A5B0S3F8_PUCGR|nr:hypothetical protein PGTUg99_006333 [Puccinia graminis f. sp. tritici]